MTSPDMRTIKTNATEHRAIKAGFCRSWLLWKLGSINCKERKEGKDSISIWLMVIFVNIKEQEEHFHNNNKTVKW